MSVFFTAADVERIPGTDRYRRRGNGRAGQVPPEKSGAWSPHSKPGPNKTELEALKILRIDAADVLFEGRGFVISGGAKYTPDWIMADGRVAIEVKGERVFSRDSRCRFDDARERNPAWRWVWARKRTTGRKGPRWEIEVYG